MRAFVVLGALVVAVVVGGVPSASAQGTKAPARSPAAIQKARESFEQGQRLFTVSRYREALEQFKNAFVAVEDPVFLYNIAQCHRLLGEKTEAARFYRRYIEAAPSGSERARAERWIAELETPEPAPAPAPIAAAPRPVTPTSPPVMTPPPAPATTSPPVATTPPPAAPPPLGSGAGLEPPPVAGDPAPAIDLSVPPPAEHRPIYKKWWFWAGVGAAVVVGGVIAATAAGGRGVTCGGGVQRCEQL